MSHHVQTLILMLVLILSSFHAVTPFLLRSASFQILSPSILQSTGNWESLRAMALNDTASSFQNDAFEEDSEFAAYKLDNYRYGFMEPLLQWAVNSGVEFAPGTEIVANDEGDWGVELVKSKRGGTPIITIPSNLIVSTKALYGTRIAKWMEQNLANPHYLPENLLVFRLIEELSKGGLSPWHVWLESLPTEFSTGLSFDSFEKSLVKRIAPNFLEEYENQWQDCLLLMGKLSRNESEIIPQELQLWLQAQVNLSATIQWAFSIVMTRSWRTPDGKDATIVPVGDMLNHHSQHSNIRPCIQRKDGSLQLCLTDDTLSSSESPAAILLSYGHSHHPGRFLVNFGFCDTTTPLVDVQVGRYLARNDLPPLSDENSWPAFLPAHLVVSTESGIMSEDVWLVFLLAVLRKRDSSQLRKVQKAYDSEDDEEIDSLLVELLEDWELPVALEMKTHFQDLLDNVYIDFAFSEHDYTQHSRLAMIAAHNAFMRKTFVGALRYIAMVADQASKDLVRSNTS